MMSASMSKPRQFTGWHMLAIMISFFSVVIAVNVLMATLARTSWTGLVVENSYVASQEFNEDLAEARREKALGWQEQLSHANGQFVITLKDAGGAPLTRAKVEVKIGHPVADKFDRDLVLAETAPGVYSAALPLTRGVWDADVMASRGSDERFRQVYRFTAEAGAQ